MRTSIAAFALFRRQRPSGEAEYLAQWNDNWRAFNLVGGHKRDDESFRDCCAREVVEELELAEGRDFRVAPERRTVIRFASFSHRAQQETEYAFELFDAELLGDSADRVVADERNRWISVSEVRIGACRDGKPVSPTMLRVLTLAGLVGDAG